jgi:hypothetical protein
MALVADCRFPIGKTEQVKTWVHEVVQNFWRKWYFPANVTLYIVGDLNETKEQVERLIEQSFGKFSAGRLGDHGSDVASMVLNSLPGKSTATESSGTEPAASHNGSADSHSNGGAAVNGNGAAAAIPVAVVPDVLDNRASNWASSVSVNGDSSSVLGEGVIAIADDGAKLRHPVRPPVLHKHGCWPMSPDEPAVPVSIFRHPLLQHFTLTLFCKLPVVSLKSLDDLKYSFMVRLLLSTFQFRINQR